MGWLKSFVSNPVGTIAETVEKVGNEAGNLATSIDQTVRDVVPGGWKTVALVAGGYYYQPELSAWVNAEGAPVATADQVAAAKVGEGASANQILTAAVPEGSAYVAPNVTTLGTVAGPTEGMLSGTGLTAGSTGTGLQATSAGGLAEMGGGQGLVSNATTGNLASMGGGQGLTTAGTGLTAGTVGEGGTALSGLTSGIASDATANAALGAGGAGVTADTIGGNLGNNLNAVVTDPNSVLTGATAGGTSLSGLLTPSNALLAKALLDTYGGNNVANAISDAAKTQQAAYEASKGDLAGLYSAQKGYQKPYQTTGVNALNNINALSTGPYTQYDYKGKKIGTGEGSGYLQHQFDTADLYSGLAPNYDFMLRQGQMANQRAANVGGGALSGNTMTGLQKYTQDYAGNAYQNAFTNYQNQRKDIYNTLSNIAGIGQNANNQLLSASNNYGTNLTNLNVGNAAAQAAAQVARAQTQGNTLSNLGNTGVLATLLNQQPTVPA